MVTPLLERARAAGLVRLPHPEVAVRLFVGPLLSYVLSDGLLAAPETSRQPTSEELGKLVDLFISAIT